MHELLLQHILLLPFSFFVKAWLQELLQPASGVFSGWNTLSRRRMKYFHSYPRLFEIQYAWVSAYTFQCILRSFQSWKAILILQAGKVIPYHGRHGRFSYLYRRLQMMLLLLPDNLAFGLFLKLAAGFQHFQLNRELQVSYVWPSLLLPLICFLIEILHQTAAR